jgi:uncharacterized protein (TIGR03435 family)
VRAPAACLLLLLPVALFAQAPSTFDVASVKRTQGAPGAIPFVFTQNGRLRAPFATVRELVQAAYGVEPNQVAGGPGWIDSEHFEINATLPAGADPRAARLMLRALLVDRFALAARQEKRDVPVYVLNRTRALGPDFSPAGSACKPLKAPAGLPAPPPPPPPPAGAGPTTPLNQPRGSICGNAIFGGFFSLRGIPMATFVTYLSRQVKRPIIDRTGLTGLYDIDLSFLPDSGPMMLNGTPLNADAPSLQTAIREQLGLRLDSARAPVEIIVIDRVNPPTDN